MPYLLLSLHSPPPAPLGSDLGTEIFPLVELRHFQAFAPGIENPYWYSNSEIHYLTVV